MSADLSWFLRDHQGDIGDEFWTDFHSRCIDPAAVTSQLSEEEVERFWNSRPSKSLLIKCMMMDLKPWPWAPPHHVSEPPKVRDFRDEAMVVARGAISA